MNDKELDRIEAEARAEAYKAPAQRIEESTEAKVHLAEARKTPEERIIEAKDGPRETGHVMIPADALAVELYPRLRHKTGNQVEELFYDPTITNDPSDSYYRDVTKLPKGVYRKDDGKYYSKVDEMKDELALSTVFSKDAYERIQREFKGKHGRPMDHDVAVIRARLAAGEIDRETARNFARALRYQRDVDLAKKTATEYYEDQMRGKGGNPYATAAKNWQDFFVDTSRLGVEVARGRRAELLEQMNREVKEGVKNAAFRNLVLARRFGFAEQTEDVPVYEITEGANLAHNYKRGSSGYWAAARRTAQSVIDDVDAKGDAASKNDLVRRANAIRRIQTDSHYRDADPNDFSGLDPLVPAKRLVRTDKRHTGQYYDPGAGDRLFRYLHPLHDDLMRLYTEEAK